MLVEQLNQYYGGSHILRNVAFEVPAGKVTALLGRNGVGKTTLLRSLMGLVPIRTGTVTFEDQDLTRAKPNERARAGLGYVPQGREIFPRLTVEENLLMGAPKVPDRIFEMFPVLKSMLGRRGGDLSGGQQQQLAIGRALAMKPRLLILDEPTEGIQPSIIKEIERAIRSLAATGEMAILLVEQYYDFARSLADQYLVMERGEIVARGAGADMDKDGVRKLLHRELRLRILDDQVPPRFLDAEERQVDVVVNHRPDERVVLGEALLVDRDLLQLERGPVVVQHLVVDDEPARNALLVAPGDPSAMAAAAIRVFAEEGLARRLVEAGAESAAGYTWAQVRPRLFGVYARALGVASLHHFAT